MNTLQSFKDLPNEIIYKILSYVGNKSFINFTLSSKSFLIFLDGADKRKNSIKRLPFFKHINGSVPHTATFSLINFIKPSGKVYIVLEMCKQHSIDDYANIFVMAINSKRYPLLNYSKFYENKYLRKYFFRIDYLLGDGQSNIVVSATKYNFVCDGFKCFMRWKI